jgi:hypothetical protein
VQLNYDIDISIQLKLMKMNNEYESELKNVESLEKSYLSLPKLELSTKHMMKLKNQ